MVGCKPTHVVLKELRDEVGATPAELRSAKTIIDEIKELSREGKIQKLAEDTYMRNKYEKMYEANENDYVPRAKPRVYRVDGKSYVIARRVIELDDGRYELHYTTPVTGNNKVVTVDKDGTSGKSKFEIQNILDAAEMLDSSRGSKAEQKINWSKYDRVEKTVHKDIGAMVELLEDLHRLGGSKESSTHLEYLKGLIGGLNPKFLTNMTTYINQKGKESGGIIQTVVLPGGKEEGRIALSISKADRVAGNQQSEAEIYAHEVIHSYVTYAIDLAKTGHVEARKLYRELQYVMSVARNEMSWKDFMPEESIDREIEEKNAKEMYSYIFNSKHAEEEFIAHVLTNPIVMDKAKKIKLKEDKKAKSLWENIKKLFGTVLDVLSGNFEFKDSKSSIQEVTERLAFRLAEYNNKAIRNAKANESVVDKLTNMINSGDDYLSERLEEVIDKYMPKGVIEEKPEGKLAKAKWLAKAVGKMVIDPVYRNQLSKIATAFGMPPEGTIQTLMRDFVEQDDLEKVVDFLALASDRIDGFKMTLIGTVKEAVENGFKDKLSKEDKKALTRVVMDTDMASIFKDYSNAELRLLLRDEQALETKIGRIKHKLKEKDNKRYNWHVNQANGLGYYLATGKAHIAQNMNATNIARGLLSAEYRSPDRELVKLIDEVATLVALKYTSKGDKLRVEKLLTKDWNGVKNLIGIANNLKSEAKKTLFTEGTTHIVKGYTKEVFDDRITMEVAGIDEKAAMEKRGFKLVKELSKNSEDKNPSRFGLYVSEAFATSEWYRTTARLTRLGTKGTTLESLYYAGDNQYSKLKWKTNKVELDTARTKLVTEMIKGELNLDKIEYGLTPVMNEDGSVVDYRYMMDKESKEAYLGMSTDVSEIAGRTRASIYDKGETDKHNKKLLDIIVKDAKENYRKGDNTGNNDKQYVLISPESRDEKILDLWNILPKAFKDEAMNSAYKGLPVRRDLMNNYFGYRHLSITDFPGLKQITPEFIKNMIRIAETLWIEFVKISKVDVIIKMPFVVVGNIISNATYAVMTGTHPRDVIKMYTESTRDVRAYLRKHRELVELQNAKATGNIRKLPIQNIKQLERELKDNPIHELYELGVYQSIVEDVSREEFTSNNKLKRWYNDKTSKVPKVIKDGVNWMYLTEETQYYKFMTEITQMSDLVARDIENRKLKLKMEKQVNGEENLPAWFLKDHGGELKKRKLTGKERAEFIRQSDEMRKSNVLNSFINYNKPSGSLEEYMNKVGLLMFTKYAKRIQRVIGQTTARYPLKSLMAIQGQQVVDVDTIQDQSVFVRSWYNMGLSEHDWIPGKPLYGYLEEVFTPTILQQSTYKVI